MAYNILKNKNFFNNSLISVKNLKDFDIKKLFELTSLISKNKYDLQFFNKKSVGLLFFQPSTRTRMSFEIACKNIGLSTIVETNPTYNSAMAKQETLHDLLKTMSKYNDAIVLRHPDEKEVFNSIKNIDIPIINGGWGNFEHPTQALIDLYTFEDKFKDVTNKKMAIVGDPNTRTAISVSELCSRFGMDITFIYPEIYQPFDSAKMYKNIICNDKKNYQENVKNYDLIYYSNFTGTEVDDKRNEIYDNYYLPKEYLENNDLCIYSPLPRRPNEMDVEADNTKYQLSFDAVENSVFLRMALINLILNE